MAMWCRVTWKTIQECLWYVYRCWSITSHTFNLQKILWVQQPRTFQTSEADTLKKLVSDLSPWMKREQWATLKKAIEELVEAIEFYVFELAEKNRAMKWHNDICSVCWPFFSCSECQQWLSHNFTANYWSNWRQRVLRTPFCVCDFTPIDRRDRYT